MKQKNRLIWWLALGMLAGVMGVIVTRPAAVSRPTLANGARATVQDRSDVFRFAVIGDSGTGDGNQLAVARQMERTHNDRPFSTVLMLGDNFYGSFDFVKKFEQPYGALLKRDVRFYASLGNHDENGIDKEIKYDKFNMDGKRYYSFRRADDLIEFFALDSTDMHGKQVAWFKEALAASPARWKVAYFHHPLYSSAKRHGADDGLRDQLEPLLTEYGVQVALSGHDHVYERLKPQKGVQYFVSGAAGKLRRGDLQRGHPDTALGNDQVFHFMLFEVEPSVLRYYAISHKGETFDQGELYPYTRARSVTQGARP